MLLRLFFIGMDKTKQDRTRMDRNVYASILHCTNALKECRNHDLNHGLFESCTWRKVGNLMERGLCPLGAGASRNGREAAFPASVFNISFNKMTFICIFPCYRLLQRHSQLVCSKVICHNKPKKYLWWTAQGTITTDKM